MSMKFKVFLYFSRKDSELAERIKLLSSSMDISVYLNEPFLPKDEAFSLIEERSELKTLQSNIVVVLLSPDLEDSLSARDGLEFAFGKKPVIAIGNEDRKPMHSDLMEKVGVYVDVGDTANGMIKIRNYFEQIGAMNEGNLLAALSILLVAREVMEQDDKKKKLLGVMYVKRKGGSLSIIIPKRIAQTLELREEDILGIYHSKGEITIKKLE